MVNDGLTPRQRRFVEEYLVDLNATQAAIRAGYAAKDADVQGPRLLGNVGVASAIAAAMAERSRRTQISTDQVLREYARIALSDIRRAVRWGDAISTVDAETGGERITNGVALLASEDIDPDTAAAISEVSQSKDGTLRIKLHYKKGALDSVARHLGMFTDKAEVTLKGDFASQQEKARGRARAARRG